MLTKADFVKWKLEGPTYWPAEINGYTYIGVYNANGDELFANFTEEKIYVKKPNNVLGSRYSIASMIRWHYKGTDWDNIKILYEAYQKCTQKQTS